MAEYMNFSIESTDAVLNDTITELNMHWRTEANCPEILHHQKQLVDEISSQLMIQQKVIDQKFDDANEKEYFTSTLYQMDIERTRYTLSRYLRTRLLKIENNLEFILTNINITDRLSIQERIFATKLHTLNTSYYEDIVANKLLAEAKEYYEASTDRYTHSLPKLQEFVFSQALETLLDVPIVDQFQTLHRGDVHILQYQVIQDYVLKGKMCLL